MDSNGSSPASDASPTKVGDVYAIDIAGRLKALGIPETYGIDRGLGLQPEARELEVVRMLSEGRRIELAPEAAAAWRSMVLAAAADGVTLLLISGFRSVQRQHEIVEGKRARGDSIEAILRVNAAPGFSEHHTGRAVDIGTPGCPPLEERFEETSAFAWLARNAGQFGFSLSYPRDNPYSIIYEPWHWFHRSLD